MTHNQVQPEYCQHRSFVYRKFDHLPVTWSEINGYAAALSIHDTNLEIEYAQKMALCDLSYIQRIGFKGIGTNEWLQTQKIIIPQDLNMAEVASNGCLIARLGSQDILVLDHLEKETNTKQRLEEQWHYDHAENKHSCGNIMPRQDSHSCFYVCGTNAPEMFSTLCAVDLRVNKFNNLMIAQTSLARISAIIIRCDAGNTPGYYVLVENVTSEYCWDCIQDAMKEYSGQLIGLSCLIDLIS